MQSSPTLNLTQLLTVMSSLMLGITLTFTINLIIIKFTTNFTRTLSIIPSITQTISTVTADCSPVLTNPPAHRGRVSPPSTVSTAPTPSGGRGV